MLRALTLVGVLAIATPASADVLKLFAEAHGGGAYGTGASGEGIYKDAAFFAKAPRGAYGALVGAEFLFLDAWIQHHQFTDGDRIATWTQFGAGVHIQVDLGTEKQAKARTGPFLDLGAGAWFGLGTGQQVDPPLDNAQISDKAFLIEGRLGLGTHLSSVFDLGVTVPVSWGFFIKNHEPLVVDGGASNHYQGVQGEALLFLRANIRLL